MIGMCTVCGGHASTANALSRPGKPVWTHLDREDWEHRPHDVVLKHHRWPSNENADRHPVTDRCLDCRVRRFTDDPEERRRAEAPCRGRPLAAVAP